MSDTSKLLELPLELQRHIWQHVLEPEDEEDDEHADYTLYCDHHKDTNFVWHRSQAQPVAIALSRTCRHLYNEIMPMLWQDKSLKFCTLDCLRNFMDLLNPTYLPALQLTQIAGDPLVCTYPFV